MMSWSEFVMTLISGSILIVFRCWIETKWKTYQHKKEDKQNNDSTK
ncbi:Trp-rich small protein [Staphylococcus felis]